MQPQKVEVVEVGAGVTGAETGGVGAGSCLPPPPPPFLSSLGSPRWLGSDFVKAKTTS